jgi:hypothetical protein
MKPKQIHDPKWGTSLYNHGAIAKDLPLIPNEEYKQLYERMPDRELYEIYLKLYTLEPKQKKMIEDILENRII